MSNKSNHIALAVWVWLINLICMWFKELLNYYILSVIEGLFLILFCVGFKAKKAIVLWNILQHTFAIIWSFVFVFVFQSVVHVQDLVK